MQKIAKWLSYAIVLVLGLALMGSIIGDDEESADAPRAAQSAAAEPEAVGLAGCVREALKGSTGVERLISVEVIDSAVTPGHKVVHVVFHAAENLTTGMTKGGIEISMRRGYHAAYTCGEPVDLATMEARMGLIDKHGNESVGIVYGTRLAATEAGKVNWENRDIIEWTRVWKTYMLNRSFR